MSVALQVLALMLAAITMGLSLAHALEFPGKRRLSKEQYLIAQRIYYPGFTVGGLAEPAVIVATLALLTLTPWATQRFWLMAARVTRPAERIVAASATSGGVVTPAHAALVTVSAQKAVVRRVRFVSARVRGANARCAPAPRRGRVPLCPARFA